jgi:sulfate adenylyltransferase
VLIQPHGGKLVNRLFDDAEAERWRMKARKLPQIRLPYETLRDVENIARGVFSPLEGFVGEEDYDSILYRMRLADGTPWTIPVLLDVTRETAGPLEPGADVALADEEGTAWSVLHLESKYSYNKEELARQVYGTTDTKHPAVERIGGMGEVLLSGSVDVFRELPDPFTDYNLGPVESRVLFRERGFQTVVAFQTRNVPHAGHEDLQRSVLGLCDGLLIHPIIGRKKKGDFRDEVILPAYRALIDNYYNPERVVLSILPTEMRYGGPREAILHAIVRKNYGCSHIIIGNDHAGVGGFYGPEDAIEIFKLFPDLEIEPITIRGDFFHCNRCARIASDRTCRHGDEDHVPFSGTIIRGALSEGQDPPPEVMRPEVAAVIRSFEDPFVS